MLQQTFIGLVQKYTNNEQAASELWNEVASHYSEAGRHYHTLAHLRHLHDRFEEVKDQINDREAVLFALYYHDIIYNTLKSNNEKKSADLARKRLSTLQVPDIVTERCVKHILATRQHLTSADEDTNYFTDADLSILGQPQDAYKAYCQNIRKEYSVYPDIIYNSGRKKVLEHFLSMERIFKTNHFFDRYEARARQNIGEELNMLS